MSKVKVLYAEYGYIEGPITGHHLIHFDGDRDLLPSQLLGLTDTPPNPTHAWLKAIGCGRLGDWFCLWWTVPNHNHHRAGVVKSKVALWSIDEISEVADISFALKQIGNLDDITDIPEEQIETIMYELISSPNPLVYTNIDFWPNLINHIWKILWPEARKNFSVQTAFSPDHISNLLMSWIYLVPESKKGSWPEDRYKRIDLEESLSNRMSQYLINKGIDSTLATYFNETILSLNHPNNLVKINRGADRCDSFIKSPSFSNAVNLLRSLNSIPISSASLDTINIKCTEAIENSLIDEDPKSILLLTNIRVSFALDVSYMKQLTNWFKIKMPSLEFEEIKLILSRLEPQSAQEWWQQSLLKCITEKILIPTPEWNILFIKILINEKSSEKIKELLTSDMEQQLISVWNYEEQPKSLENLIDFCRKNNWYNLHAKCMVKCFKASEAFEKQIHSFNNLGLNILTIDLPGEEAVEEIILRRCSLLNELMSNRTVKEPELINSLNIMEEGWLDLWLAHIEKGGAIWPPALDPEKIAHSLLDNLINEVHTEKTNEIISKKTIEIATYAITYHKRKELWDRLNPFNADSISNKVSTIILNRSNILITQEPEFFLSQKVIRLASDNDIRLSDIGITSLIQWKTISEQQVKDILMKNNWSNSSEKIGIIVNNNKWKAIAEYIYSLHLDKPEFTPAARQIKNLLSRSKRFFIIYSSAKHKEQSSATFSKNDLIPIISDIASDLAPTRLESIWIRAGGKLKSLNHHSNLEDAWLQAIRIAYENEEPNFDAIIDVLINDFPRNEILLAIKKQLASFKK